MKPGNEWGPADYFAYGFMQSLLIFAICIVVVFGLGVLDHYHLLPWDRTAAIEYRKMTKNDVECFPPNIYIKPGNYSGAPIETIMKWCGLTIGEPR